MKASKQPEGKQAGSVDIKARSKLQQRPPKVIKQFGPAARLALPPARLNRPAIPAQPKCPRPLATMPRKGTATVKKKTKKITYVEYNDDDFLADEELPDSPSHGTRADSHVNGLPAPKEVDLNTSDNENVDPTATREQLRNLSNEAQRGQPRQAAPAVTAEQSAALAQSLFPDNDTAAPQHLTTPAKRPRKKKQQQPRAAQDTPSSPPNPASDLVRRTRKLALTPAKRKKTKPTKRPSSAPTEPASPPPAVDADNDILIEDADPPNMIQGGAHIPPNQQRNMRACMVCSIVRTQHQFATQGCPNCEDFLELANNAEQINDCTSQVFEGLITVADTTRSWVARYQRLEGYVAGVYAIQVEGILPEDVLVAVENAGVNYVPRDGSEQEMLGKD